MPMPALLLAVSLASAPGAAAKPAFSHSGRWIVDSHGRVVIFHGAAVVIGGFGGPHDPEQDGFGAADARFLAGQGLGLVRLGIFDQYLEPTPGHFDDAYLNSIARTQRLLAKRGIVTVLDLHQDLLATKYAGRGFADWFPVDDGVPNMSQFGFPSGYLLNPAVSRAYDNLWANAIAGDGVGAVDHIAAAWRHIARRFRGARRLLGYDLFNEPWPGSQYPSCLSAAGCPPGGFDQTALTAFFNRVVASVRMADRKRLVFAEPNLMFDFGAATGLGKLDDRRVGLSFHDYCLNYVAPNRPDPGNLCKPSGESFVFQNADAYSQRTNAALLMTEFGDTPDPAVHQEVAGLADRFMVGWTDWAYIGSSGNVKVDEAKPPTPDNVNSARLDAIVRAYPEATAGTPLSYGYDPVAKRFRMSYSTRGPSGKRFAGARPVTKIFVPARVYGRRYRVRVNGARVVGSPDVQVLRLRDCRGARTVRVKVVDKSPVSRRRCRSGHRR